jgi:hypothetical protein
MNSLGKVIKKKKATKNIEALSRLIKKAPYSQPIQKLAKELSIEDNDLLLRYEWIDTQKDGEKAVDTDPDVLSMSVIKIKDKAKKQPKNKAKKTTSPKEKKKKEEAKKPKKEVIAPEIKATKKKKKKTKTSTTKANDKKAKAPSLKKEKTKSPKSNKSAKAKNKNNSKKQTEKLDDYTEWLNSLNKEENISKPPKNKKAKVIKSKKKATKKTELKKKISQSVKANDKIASKSLAKLYEKEGHYKKAIKVYKELSLKNPRKSSFFAAQIEKIKDKL